MSGNGDPAESRSNVSRRDFLAQATALGAALALSHGCARQRRGPLVERRDLYPQGVASADPAPDSVILWTRREPDRDVAKHHLAVEVADDPGFSRIVAAGEVDVTAATDWTCRFLAAGLQAGREYWYRFVDEAGHTSRTGRALTAPAESDDRPVQFAFVSCQDITQGACNAYRRMIHEDLRRPRAEQLSFVLHLGDFIYEVVWYPEESKDGHKRGRRLRDIVRYPHGEKMQDFHLPTDLEDYRAVYRGYLLDQDLQDARARWPFVPVWDNHEFSWRGYQSQQYFDNAPRPAQRMRVAASRAWYEYQPARVVKPGNTDIFAEPHVDNKPLTRFDALGLGLEENNLAAISALRIHRAFRFGKSMEMLLTDTRSYMSPPANIAPFSPDTCTYMTDEAANEILDLGRTYNSGHPPATIQFGQSVHPNTQADAPPQAYLGVEQLAWFKERLRLSRAPWKIWGHSFGTLTWRADLHNLPTPLRSIWPGSGYGILTAGNAVENGEIFDFVRDQKISGFAIVAGDKHSFWAGYPSKSLPPRSFDPVGVEFITGSISSQGLAEIAERIVSKQDPLRALYVHERDGRTQCSLNTTVLHGVRAALALEETGDLTRARALRNPDVAPHLKFGDFGGHGYATVRVSPDELVTEFVCIPRPLERNAAEDGGPLTYRVRHRVKLWEAGGTPNCDKRL